MSDQVNEREKVVNRVRKMLALANDAGAAEGERDNAMRMAHKLMAKHAIDSIEFEARPGAEKEARIEKEFEFYGRPWARNVAANIARAFFCSYLYKVRYGTKIAVHSFVGRESNTISAGEIARFVVEAIHKEAKRKQREAYGNNDWYRSFCWGAANSVARRCNEMIAEATKTTESVKGSEPTYSRGTALVLASFYQIEATENRALIARMYPKLAAGRSGHATSSQVARGEGARYGNSVSLSRQVGDGRIKGQLK